MAHPARVVALAGVLGLGTLAAGSLSAPAANAVAFAPTDDAYVDSTAPEVAYGRAAEARIDAFPLRHAYLRFDVQGLAAPVSRATLRIYSRTAHWLGLDVRSVDATSWSEETLTYENAPQFSPSITASSGSIGVGTWLELDVTPLVSGNGAVAFALTTNSVTNLPLAMKESGDALAPQLVVETETLSASDSASSTTTESTQTETAPSQASQTETTPTQPTSTETTPTDAAPTETTPTETTRTETAPTETTPTETTPTDTTPTPDATPPSTPGGLRLTGATTTSVSLAWDASNDDVGVSGYGVYSGGALIASSAETSFMLSGLMCASSYTVTVDAFDAAGNRSLASPPLEAATIACPDLLPPTAPGNFRAVDATASTINVSWDASTDDVGVTGYRLYRDGVFVAGTSASAYTFDMLDCASGYELAVDAFDAAGNVSARETLTAGTAACAPHVTTVAVAGDIASDGGGDAATAAILDSLQPTAVLTAGDNAYPDGSLAQYMRYYDPTWGRHKALTFPTPGNHEYESNDAADYFSYFGARAGEAGKGWYSYDAGSWHLISLNSELDHNAGSEQLTWLRDDLAATAATCVLAYWHRPRFSSGSYDDKDEYQPFWDALYAAGAEIVVNGHDHNYQRYAPLTPAGERDDERGIREFVVGTGGRNHYGLHADARREAGDATTYGVLALTLRDTGYDWSFVPEAGKTYTDSGSGSCH